MTTTDEQFVLVNGDRIELAQKGTLAAVLGELGVEPNTGGVAVALDGAVIPRSQWGDTSLEGGEEIEIVRAVQGG